MSIQHTNISPCSDPTQHTRISGIGCSRQGPVGITMTRGIYRSTGMPIRFITSSELNVILAMQTEQVPPKTILARPNGTEYGLISDEISSIADLCDGSSSIADLFDEPTQSLPIMRFCPDYTADAFSRRNIPLTPEILSGTYIRFELDNRKGTIHVVQILDRKDLFLVYSNININRYDSQDQCDLMSIEEFAKTYGHHEFIWMYY